MTPFLITATAHPGVVAVYDLKTESIFRVIESGRDCDKTVKGMRKAMVRVLKKRDERSRWINIIVTLIGECMECEFSESCSRKPRRISSDRVCARI